MTITGTQPQIKRNNKVNRTNEKGKRLNGPIDKIKGKNRVFQRPTFKQGPKIISPAIAGPPDLLFKKVDKSLTPVVMTKELL